MLLDVGGRGFSNVRMAFDLVMAGFAQGPHGTALDTFSANPFGVIEAMGLMMGVGPGRWGD